MAKQTFLNLNEDSNYYIEGEEVYIDIIVYNEKIPAPIIEELINKDDNKTNGEDKKLPYLGIYDISILYTFMLVPILKRDKKINN